jgi:hypothetical protein
MFVVVSIHVEELEKPVTFKLVPLAILEIGVGITVTLIFISHMPLRFLKL